MNPYKIVIGEMEVMEVKDITTMMCIHGRYVKHYAYFSSVHVRLVSPLGLPRLLHLTVKVPTYRDGFVQPVGFYPWFHN